MYDNIQINQCLNLYLFGSVNGLIYFVYIIRFSIRAFNL